MRQPEMENVEETAETICVNVFTGFNFQPEQNLFLLHNKVTQSMIAHS